MVKEVFAFWAHEVQSLPVKLIDKKSFNTYVNGNTQKLNRRNQALSANQKQKYLRLLLKWFDLAKKQELKSILGHKNASNP